mmetsp:Transcript_34073/g.59422  ORF Transcript_34073/g.59422 Transcript_34073/m.59422 type:complete len:122 (-) Transcript_34073:46-411(-)
MIWFICLALAQAEGISEGKSSLKDKGNPVSFPLYFMSVLRHNLWIFVAAAVILLAVAVLFVYFKKQDEKPTEQLTEKGGLVLRGRTKRQPRVRWYGVLSDDKKPNYGGCDLTNKLMSPCKL